AHSARAADHHPAALAVGERPVVVVLHDVEAVEEGRLLRRVDLELLELALAGARVEAPDLQADLHPAAILATPPQKPRRFGRSAGYFRNCVARSVRSTVDESAGGVTVTGSP